MTSAERGADYWRSQACEFEAQVKQRTQMLGVTVDELADLRDKADRFDAHQRAVDEARSNERVTADGEAHRAVVAAQLDALAAHAGVGEARLAKVLDGVDLTQFTADDGTVDANAITAFVADIAPPSQPAGPVWTAPLPSGAPTRSLDQVGEQLQRRGFAPAE